MKTQRPCVAHIIITDSKSLHHMFKLVQALQNFNHYNHTVVAPDPLGVRSSGSLDPLLMQWTRNRCLRQPVVLVGFNRPAMHISHKVAPPPTLEVGGG